MVFSDFGKKMNNDAGILNLMDDLGKALADTPPIAMFGGGNPAAIPEIIDTYSNELRSILQSPSLAASMLGSYDTPQGNSAFIITVKNFLNRHYSVDITEDNIAISAGSQTGYFMLFNILAGKTGNSFRKILFPIVPEYIGYVDQGLEPDMFVSHTPKVRKLGNHSFKYSVDFDALKLTNEIAAIAVSRPTNPSGNMISYNELSRLAKMAKKNDSYLLIDNAYGNPFPGVIKSNELFWDDNVILSMSLSKVGLPTSRVGIFVGPKNIMKALASANAIISLASPSIGQYIAKPLLENDAIIQLCTNVIQPYYESRRKAMDALIKKHFPHNLPWRLHVYEGSYFYWLWCEGAKLSSIELYEWLKKRGVLVVPGEYFFPGLDGASWPHVHECLRINFSRPDTELEKGVPILAEAIKEAYSS